MIFGNSDFGIIEQFTIQVDSNLSLIIRGSPLAITIIQIRVNMRKFNSGSRPHGCKNIERHIVDIYFSNEYTTKQTNRRALVKTATLKDTLNLRVLIFQSFYDSFTYTMQTTNAQTVLEMQTAAWYLLWELNFE